MSYAASTAEGRSAGIRTLAVGYRLAPEHPFPAALEDAKAAYAVLLDRGVSPNRIAVGGDSAGAGLTLALLTSLRDAGGPLPACAWLLSPWVDLEMQGATIESKAAVDPLIQKPYLEDLASAYLAGHDPKDPLVSPLFADLKGLPPLLAQVGSSRRGDCSATPLTEPDMRARIRLFGSICQNSSDSWADTRDRLRSFHKALSEAIRPSNQDGG